MEWGDVVKEARRRVACPNLGPDEGGYALGGLDPLPVGPPIPGAHAVVRSEVGGGSREGRGRRGRPAGEGQRYDGRHYLAADTPASADVGDR